MVCKVKSQRTQVKYSSTDRPRHDRTSLRGGSLWVSSGGLKCLPLAWVKRAFFTFRRAEVAADQVMVSSVAGSPSGAAAPTEQCPTATAVGYKSPAKMVTGKTHRRKCPGADEHSDLRYFPIFFGKHRTDRAGRQDH